MNVLVLHGNLASDPELRFTPKGSAICSFTIAVSERWTTESGEQKERVGFFGCVVWGKKGEVFSQYHRKGGKALIRGKLIQESWEDKQTGKKQSKTKVQVEEWEFAGGKREDSGQGAPPVPRPPRPQPVAQPEAPAGEAPPTDDDDVPF